MTTGPFHGGLLAADLVAAWVVACIISGFVGTSSPDWETALPLAGAVVAVHLLALAYTPGLRPRFLPAWAGLLAGNLVAGLVLPVVFGASAGGTIRLTLLGFTPLQLGWHALQRRWLATAPLEPLRLSLILAGGVGIGFPLLTSRGVGTGDAYWYGNMVADFAAQWRAGIFPVFVGQSDFAFNGAVSPLRLAPYLQHAAGIVDLLTARTLPLYGLVNLTLFLSLLGGAASAYVALVAMEGRTRWAAMLLALLYIGSPAVLSLVYTGDLFMSVCTLPYLPLVMLGTYLTLTTHGRTGIILLASALAATWLCHPPIAFWATVLATLGQLIRLVAGPIRDRRLWTEWLLGAALFSSLTLFLFVSMGTLGLPAAVVEPALIITGILDAYPAALLPVSEGASAVSDYQLGWPLWAVLLLGLGGMAAGRRSWQMALGLGASLLLLLILPVPDLIRTLWSALPQPVINLTFYWPMQRFTVLIAIAAVILGYGAVAGAAARRPWLHAVLALGLLQGLHWTSQQAEFFLRRATGNTATAQATINAHKPANRLLTRYAYNPFPQAPAYFSHGYVDPIWENRLLASGSWGEIVSNYDALRGPTSIVRAEGEINARQAGAGSLYYALLDNLPLEPGRHYLLEFEFARPALTGTLVASSRTLTRTYELPDSGIGVPRAGDPTGFGSLPSSKKSLSLFNSSASQDLLSVQFVASQPIAEDLSRYGRYVLREYDPVKLPIIVESWVPYRSRVMAATAAWVETPRIYTSGYRATVNGNEVRVERSPGGLVAVPVAIGENRIVLDHPGPLALRVSYYLSLFCWLGMGALLTATVVRHLRQPVTSPPGRAAAQ